MSMRMLYMIAWLACALWAKPPAIAHAFTYAQQLVQLEQANRAFEQALISPTPQDAQGYYQQAIAGYEQLVAVGIHNAKLYYNLGNAYFHRNDLGRAILHYRRGLRLEPGNRQLQANLSYARSRRIDQIDVSGQPQHAFLTQLFFWSDELSVPTQWTLALAGYCLAWGCAFAHLIWRRASLLWGLAGATFFCLIFASSSWLTQAQVYDQAGRRYCGGGSRGAQRQRRELYAAVATTTPRWHGIHRARSTGLLACYSAGQWHQRLDSTR